MVQQLPFIIYFHFKTTVSILKLLVSLLFCFNIFEIPCCCVIYLTEILRMQHKDTIYIPWKRMY